MDTNHPLSAGTEADRDNWLEIVRQHVQSLRYGVVEIVVQDSRVVQIEKTERTRFDKPAPKTGNR
jgi:hypothetical protein